MALVAPAGLVFVHAVLPIKHEESLLARKSHTHTRNISTIPRREISGLVLGSALLTEEYT
jgi:hypothetical protein